MRNFKKGDIYLVHLKEKYNHVLVVAGKSISNVAGNDRKIRFSEEFDKIESGSEIYICSHKLKINN